MTRILVHAGFHKTGTTSLQAVFELNRAALAPWLDYRGKAEVLPAGTAARVYAVRRTPLRLRDFRLKLRAVLGDMPEGRTLVISRETLCGAMPGHRTALGRTIRDYRPAAIPLARVIRDELHRRFGPGADVSFLYTLRDPEDWLASVHGHLLRSIRMTDDLAAFRDRLGGTPDLEAMAARIRTALAPTPVHLARLEALAPARLGPAQAVFDILGLPTETALAPLAPALSRNSGPPDWMRAAFLDLNRNIADPALLRLRKAALLSDAKAELQP